jgi:transcriptional regulator with GAF, ATPase, and Fis domain
LSRAALEVAPAAGLAAEGADADASTLSGDDLRQLGELAAALEVARPDAASVVEMFLAHLPRLVPFDTCAVTLAADDGEPRTEHAAGEHAALLRGRLVAHEEGVTGWVIANQKPFFNVDPSLDFAPDTAASFAGYRTLAAVPVSSGQRAHGALTLYSSSLSEYTPDHGRLLTAAASVLATALAPAARATPEVKIAHPSLHNSDTPPAILEGDALKRLRTTIESELTH